MRPFSVRMHERAGLVQAEDLVGALVIARATWPGEQILSVIEVESPPTPPKRRGRPPGTKNRPKAPRVCGHIDRLSQWSCALPKGHHGYHKPAPVRRKPGPKPGTRWTQQRRAAIAEPEEDERSKDGTRLCECGNPSTVQEQIGKSSRACGRCRELEGAFISTNRQDQAYVKKLRNGEGSAQHSTRTLPQIDSRNLGRRLGHLVRELNRIKPYSEL